FPTMVVIGKTDFEVFPNELAVLYHGHAQRVRSTCEALVTEEPVPQIDGSHTRLSVQFPLEMRDGKPGSICGISTDITKRMRDERALRESKLHLSHAQRIAKLGHWIWDEADRRVVYSSEELARVFGVSRAAFPTTGEGWAAFIHPDDRDRVMETSRAAVDDKTGYELEYRIVRDDGETRWIRVLTEAEFDDAGRFIRVLGTAQDITERKAADDALRAKTATVALLQAVAVAANDWLPAAGVAVVLAALSAALVWQGRSWQRPGLQGLGHFVYLLALVWGVHAVATGWPAAWIWGPWAVWLAGWVKAWEFRRAAGQVASWYALAGGFLLAFALHEAVPAPAFPLVLLAESALLIWAGRLWRRAGIRGCGHFGLAVAWAWMIATLEVAAGGPWALAPWMVAVGLLAIGASDWGRDWDGARPLYAFAGAILAAAAISVLVPPQWRAMAWAAECLALVGAGISWRVAQWRGLGLAGFGLMVVRLMFVNLGGAPTVGKMLSVFGLGILLLAGAWGYNRLTAERGARGEAEPEPEPFAPPGDDSG
ncbi:PAS domain-containing protein, partial [bacterium]|nr:PAS domain-containing protein [bacterium]